MDQNMLTVLIPTKNHGSYLDELISNVIFADKSPVSRLLICNDAATDDTAAILEKYVGDERIRVFTNSESIGAMASIVSMYQYVETPYVTFTASDDFFFPDKMADLLREIVRTDAYVGFGKYVILENGHTTQLQHPGWQARSLPGADEFCSLLGFDHYAFLCTTILRKEFLPQHAGERIPYDLSLNELVRADGLGEFRGQDWNVLLEMARDYPDKIYFLNEYCGCFRKVASQLSSDEIYVHTGRAAFEMAILLLRYLGDYTVRKRIKKHAGAQQAIKNLFYAKAGMITETAKQTENFIEIYKPMLLAADTLLNNM